MRIAFVTNMEKNSAISRETLILARHIRDVLGHDVELFSPKRFSSKESDFPVHLFEDPDYIVPWLKEFDHVVYTLGNSYHHIYNVYLLRQVPGFCIVHDIDISDLMTIYVNEFGSMSLNGLYQRPEVAPKSVASDLKLNTQADILLFTKSKEWRQANHQRLVLSGAYGWLTHSMFAYDLIRSCSNSPGFFSHLPFTTIDAHNSGEPFVYKEECKRIVILGNINRNKSVEKTIEAIHILVSSGENVILRLAGEVNPDYFEELKQVIEELGIEESVVFTGRLTDIQYDDELNRASLFINLRHPVSEASSYSLFEQMNTGKPVISYSVGHYVEIPDEYLLKLPLDADASVLASSLSASLRLIDKSGDDRSSSAQQYLRKQHSLFSYADELLESLQSLSVEKVAKEGILDFAINSHRNLGSLGSLSSFLSDDLAWICQSDNND
jgi:glycosyltransferase involved in cell wall biosynthesis